jgi:hypothetical protein
MEKGCGRKIEKFARTNYWMRGKPRMPKTLEAIRKSRAAVCAKNSKSSKGTIESENYAA